ncbi:MAG TPA: outer membrane beta-barrel protein, partial [Chitinophagaceae bacterium]|nr:outer membrane beta-barrel protein [Chitinophagaceae bacterium]
VMPVNEFEKQVQQKMDELQFAPSAAVWQGVERQIAPRRKRRIIFWIFLLAALSGGAAWWYNTLPADHQPATEMAIQHLPANDDKLSPATKGNPAPDEAATDRAATKTTKTSSETASPTSTAAKEGNQQLVEPTESLKASQPTASNTNVAPAASNIKRKKTAPVTGTTANEATGKNTIDNTRNTEAVAAPDIIPATKAGIHQRYTRANKENQHHKDNGNAVDDFSTPSAGIANAEPTVSTVSTLPASRLLIPFSGAPTLQKNLSGIHTADLFNDSVIIEQRIAINHTPDSLASATHTASLARKKKFSWGIAVQGGVSNISQGLTGAFKSMPSYDVASSYQNAASPPGTGSNNAASVAASPVTRGFGYAVGVFINRPLSARLRLSLGMNYRFSSTHMQVNKQPDSALGGSALFTAGTNYNYTNKLHFLEWPLTVQQALGRRGRWNVNTGLTLTVLTGNTTLVYDAAAKRYTSADDAINKTQFGFTAGIYYRLLKRSTHIELGPQFNYGFSNMFNSNVYGNRHPLFAGFRAAVLFSK